MGMGGGAGYFPARGQAIPLALLPGAKPHEVQMPSLAVLLEQITEHNKTVSTVHA